MTNNTDNNLKQILDEASKGATYIIANPDTIKKMKDLGLPVVTKIITNEEYVEKLFESKKKEAINLIGQLPQIDTTVSDSVIMDIFEEVKKSYTLGIFTAAITNAIMLLEYAMRSKLFERLLKSDPNFKWEAMEKWDMDSLISKLYKAKIILDTDRVKLADFSSNFRNPYFHINIYKLIQGVMIEKLPGVNIHTKEKTILENVEASKHRFLWFSAKRFFDKYHVLKVINYCVEWTNKLLSQNKSMTS